MWLLIRIYSKWGDFVDFRRADSCPLRQLPVMVVALPPGAAHATRTRGRASGCWVSRVSPV